MEEKAIRIHSSSLKKQAAVVGIPLKNQKSNRTNTQRNHHEYVSLNDTNLYYQKRTQQNLSELSENNSGNPLRRYSRVIDMMNMHKHNMINRGTDVKEEGQQCNFDEITQGMCTTVNLSTPDIPPINESSIIDQDQSQLKNRHAADQDNTDFAKSFYQRSQTAASQYLNQARRMQKNKNQSRDSQRSQVNTTAITEVSRVKMTRSQFRHQQDLELQKVGIPSNARPLSKSSGTMGVIHIKNQSKSHSRNVPQQLLNYKSQKQDLSSSYSTNNNLMQSLQKTKKGGYISFQTNVDNSQAIIPMILSNEDLLRTADENPPSQLKNTQNNEDLKKTILSRQHRTNFQPSRLNQQNLDASQSYGRSVPQMQPRMQNQMYIYEQASSDEYSYQLSKRNIDIYPYAANPKDPNVPLSRNFHKSHNTSRMGVYKTVTNFKDNFNNFSGPQQVQNFAFEIIPDYKKVKDQYIKDHHIKKVLKQSAHEGRNQTDVSYAVVSASALMNKTAQHLPSQPLFISSTKKTPGLQKECAGSYVNVINNRTCLGQQNVFKFSMDLPLRLKQQMWKQHKEGKTDLLDENTIKENELENKQEMDHQQQQSRVQLGLEVIGTSSRLQEQSPPHFTNSKPNLIFNQSSSASQLPFGNRHHWSPTSITHHQVQNPQTVEISKKDLLYMDSDISPYINQASAQRYQQDQVNVSPPPKKQIQSEPYLPEVVQKTEEIKPLKPSQLKLNIQDSNNYSQAISSENHSHRQELVNQLDQLNESSLAGKKSKIIYSINKSTQNKSSNVNRSKVGALDIIINSGTAQLRRSLESRGSKEKKQMYIYNNKSTISSKHNHDNSQIMPLSHPLPDSAAASSIVASQDHLLPRTSMNANQQQLIYQKQAQNVLKPLKQLRKITKEDSFADKSPDLKHLSKHPPPLPVEMPGIGYTDSAEMPVLRSQNASFKRPRKITSAVKRDKSIDFVVDLHQQHTRNESQRLKLANIEFDPEREFERLHDFNITQISIKVDSKRNTLDFSSQARLQQVTKALIGSKQFNTTTTNNENKSIASQPSTGQHNAKEQKSTIKKSSMKVNSRKGQTNNEFLKIKTLSIRERNMSQMDVLRIINEQLPHNNLEDQHLNLTSGNDSLSRYTSLRAKQTEAKTNQLKSRIRSAAAPITKSTFLRAMTLEAPIMDPLIEEATKDVSNVGKKLSLQSSILTKESQRNSEGEVSSVEATHIQLIKPQPEELKVSKQVQIEQVVIQKEDNNVSEAKLPLVKSENQSEQEECKGFMIIKENDRQSPASPLLLEKQQSINVEDDLMKKSTISIGDEDFGFFHQTKRDETQARKTSGEYGQLILNSQEEPDRYPLQAAIMEKVVVKSPGRQTTEHVVSSFNPDPNYHAVSSFQLPLLSRNGSNQHHRRNSSASGKKDTLSQSRRRSFLSNNKDMTDVVGDLSPGGSSAKRTVLIRKSKGQSDVTELIIQPNSINKDSAMKAIDKTSNGNKSSTRGNVQQKINNQIGSSLPPNQFLAFEDINKQMFQEVGGQSYSAIGNVKKGTQLPRHGHAPPSVIRRNKETINRKKQEKDKNYSTFYSQNTTAQPFSDSRAQTATQLQQNMLAATFHVMPVTQSKSQQSRNGTFYNTKVHQQTSKTPAAGTVYHHTSQMQALVIHQSELAIDSSQQRMQMRLIQAYHNHQNHLKLMEQAPVLLQNERVVSSTQPPLPQVMFPQAILMQSGIQDSFESNQIMEAKNGGQRITEVDSSKDLSKQQYESTNNPLLVRGSVSSASIKGEVNLSGSGINTKIVNTRQTNNNGIILQTKISKFARNNYEQQTNSSKDFNESKLSVVGKNLKSGQNNTVRSQSGNLLIQE